MLLLLLARRCEGLREGVGVEIQRELWEYAAGNIVENGFQGRLTAVLGDFREGLPDVPGGAFDLVISNPPYRKIGEGRRNPDPQKEIARHEVTCTMSDLFAAAERHLSPRGRFAVVVPPTRLPEVFGLAPATGIVPEAVRFIHPYADSMANRVLVLCSRRRSPELLVLPPLCVYSGKRLYHREVGEIFSRFFRE